MAHAKQIPPSTNPYMSKPQLLTINSLAKATGHDRRTIIAALEDVQPTIQGVRKLYPLAVARAALATRVSPALKQQRIREVQARADLLELRLKRERGELVDLKALADEIGPMLVAFRAMVYQKFEMDAPIAMAGMGVPEARIIGQRMADELLTRLGEIFKKWKV